MRDRLARDHFVDAVNDDEMQCAIIQAKPSGIEDTLGSAIEYEAFQQTNIRIPEQILIDYAIMPPPA